MDAREQRGLEIAACCRLRKQGALWHVPSQTQNRKQYKVDLQNKTCTCPDCQDWGHKCKHIFAVEFRIRRECGSDGTVTETRQVKITETVTYPQDWPAYNKAQTQETSWSRPVKVLAG
jgi:hypothetical protein